MASKTLIKLCLTTGEKILLKSTHSLWVKPFATKCDLNLALSIPRIPLVLFENSFIPNNFLTTKRFHQHLCFIFVKRLHFFWYVNLLCKFITSNSLTIVASLLLINFLYHIQSICNQISISKSLWWFYISPWPISSKTPSNYVVATYLKLQSEHPMLHNEFQKLEFHASLAV